MLRVYIISEVLFGINNKKFPLNKGKYAKTQPSSFILWSFREKKKNTAGQKDEHRIHRRAKITQKGAQKGQKAIIKKGRSPFIFYPSFVCPSVNSCPFLCAPLW